MSTALMHMRALKKGKYGTVQYVSDNYTVRNKDLISKHVFAITPCAFCDEEEEGKDRSSEQGVAAILTALAAVVS